MILYLCLFPGLCSGGLSEIGNHIPLLQFFHAERLIKMIVHLIVDIRYYMKHPDMGKALPGSPEKAGTDPLLDPFYLFHILCAKLPIFDHFSLHSFLLSFPENEWIYCTTNPLSLTAPKCPCIVKKPLYALQIFA